MLTQKQIADYWTYGFVAVDGALDASAIAPLKKDFELWVQESRQHEKPFGEMRDGRPRFDLESGHSAERPGLRRVSAPEEISRSYYSLIESGPLVEAVVALLGEDVRFHHAKLNSKLPGVATVVKWHQDFTFDPHSNDDCVTVMLYLHDVTTENGPLRVVPGSHRGPLYSLRRGEVFTGAVDESVALECDKSAVECTGRAGDLFLMHTRTLHSSSVNRSDSPRTLFIANLTAADAVPLAANAVPSVHSGMLVHGCEPGRVRASSFDVEIPELPDGASFFTQQQMNG